jgi:hypothetical protein
MMTYQITGLSPQSFSSLIGADDMTLGDAGAIRVTATADAGFPCRISLQDANAGETLILLHHTSHDVATPYRSSYAIYIRENATQAAHYVDALPPVFEGRPLGLRGFDAKGMLRGAMLALPGQADARIREMFENDEIAYIDAHNAAHGCFAARVERG